MESILNPLRLVEAILVRTGIGMVQTEANNLYYGQNKSVLLGGGDYWCDDHGGLRRW